MNNERDTWWLVERRGCQLWATGRGSFHSLTNDATRAERFASKFDAEEEIRCAEDHFRDELVATEHKFIGAVDPEGTNAQLLANALSRAEIAEARISSLQSSIRMAMDDVPGWYDSCIAALNLPDISAVSDHASQIARAEARATASESEAAALRERVGVLEKALEPFAKTAAYYEPNEGDDADHLWGENNLKIGDLRRARTALEGRE